MLTGAQVVSGLIQFKFQPGQLLLQLAPLFLFLLVSGGNRLQALLGIAYLLLPAAAEYPAGHTGTDENAGQHGKNNIHKQASLEPGGKLINCAPDFKRRDNTVTIGELVAGRGAQMRVFDMGRRVSDIALSDFAAFEQQQQPWATPYLKHAWLGILSWSATAPGQHNIWFLKLPLDEQNQLQAGPRDAFLQFWLRVMAAPDQQHGDAPCSYKPDASRMAYFHALALQVLEQEPTQYYTTARAYLSGDIGWDNWQQLGLQGLAEVVARIGQEHNAGLLARALPNLPAIPRNALLGFLENTQPDQTLTSAINDTLAAVVAQQATAVDLAAFARALSQSVNISQRQQLLAILLQHPHRHSVELLAAIGSRCWQDLHGPLLQQYLENLAQNEQGAGAFNALVADLLALPGMRGQFLQVMAGTPSAALQAAFDTLLQQTRGASGATLQ